MRNFKSDLQKGLLGQQVFAKIFKNAVHIDGKRGDLKIGEDKIELKVDFYDMEKTRNFFMERWSNLNSLKPGGPWQAAEHGCQWFVYFYMQGMQGWIWKTEDLVKQLEALESRLKPRQVRNMKWTTVGYTVDRNLLRSEYRFDVEGVSGDLATNDLEFAKLWGHAKKGR